MVPQNIVAVPSGVRQSRLPMLVEMARALAETLRRRLAVFRDTRLDVFVPYVRKERQDNLLFSIPDASCKGRPSRKWMPVKNWIHKYADLLMRLDSVIDTPTTWGLGADQYDMVDEFTRTTMNDYRNLENDHYQYMSRFNMARLQKSHELKLKKAMAWGLANLNIPIHIDIQKLPPIERALSLSSSVLRRASEFVSSPHV